MKWISQAQQSVIENVAFVSPSASGISFFRACTSSRGGTDFGEPWTQQKANGANSPRLRKMAWTCTSGQLAFACVWGGKSVKPRCS